MLTIIVFVVIFILIYVYHYFLDKKELSYISLDGKYFNKHSNTSIKIKHIKDDTFHVECFYNKEILIDAALDIKQGIKKYYFSFHVNGDFFKIRVKDKNNLYIEYDIVNHLDDNLKAFQGLYTREI